MGKWRDRMAGMEDVDTNPLQPQRLMRAIDRAATDDAALLDVTVNPDEPPMPGNVNYEQAEKFAKSFFSGQPRKATIATILFKDKIRELRA